MTEPQYQSVDEIPETMIKELGEGVVALSLMLRKWRDHASLDSLTARWLGADQLPIEITCDAEDRIWVGTDAWSVEFTKAVDA